MTNTDTLREFIKNNNLTFEEGERNANAVVLCGYALYLGATLEECKDSIHGKFFTSDLAQELERVWKSANNNNYGAWWKKEKNRKMYKI